MKDRSRLNLPPNVCEVQIQETSWSLKLCLSTLTTTTKNRCPVWICSICAWVASHLKGQRTGEFLSFEPQPCVTPSDKYHFGSAENLRKAWVKPKTTLGQNTWNVNLKLRAVPGCRCQIAQDHYQKQRDLTLNCTQQDREQKPRSTWQVNLLLQPVIFRQGAQHRRCRSLIFESTITRDCERHEFRNTVKIFLFPLGNQCWTHLCLVRHFWFVSKREKKCVSKDIFCSHKSRRSVSAVSVKIPSTFRSLGLLTTTSTSSSHKKNGR